jgi:hypothetical protein
MKTKILHLLVSGAIIIAHSSYAQVQLRSDNKFMVGYKVYTPLTLGYYTSKWIPNA